MREEGECEADGSEDQSHDGYDESSGPGDADGGGAIVTGGVVHCVEGDVPSEASRGGGKYEPIDSTTASLAAKISSPSFPYSLVVIVRAVPIVALPDSLTAIPPNPRPHSRQFPISIRSIARAIRDSPIEVLCLYNVKRRRAVRCKWDGDGDEDEEDEGDKGRHERGDAERLSSGHSGLDERGGAEGVRRKQSEERKQAR